MEEGAYEVAAKYMNVKELFVRKEKYKGKDGKVNMCKAMQEWSDFRISTEVTQTESDDL